MEPVVELCDKINSAYVVISSRSVLKLYLLIPLEIETTSVTLRAYDFVISRGIDRLCE